ncbi:glutamyl-tRNA amidotransferase [Ferviditalea candida]|uniref:glutamyl-tRNA amidotransferase n=1 Tax=Ferviditalea candida TaxID=3108399 RepID=UPI003FA372F9
MMTLKGNLKKLFVLYTVLVLMGTVFVSTAYAEGDPMTTINNLSTFIFGLIRAIGMIILGFGIVQIGLSLKSHDPSQRANGFLTLAGGVIITFTKEILTLIAG